MAGWLRCVTCRGSGWAVCQTPPELCSTRRSSGRGRSRSRSPTRWPAEAARSEGAGSERVAGAELARAVALREPGDPLRRRPVGPLVLVDAALRLLLDPVVTDR